MSDKKKYQVSVELIRAYAVTVEATSAGDALRMVIAMTSEEVDTKGEHIDTRMLTGNSVGVEPETTH